MAAGPHDKDTAPPGSTVLSTAAMLAGWGEVEAPDQAAMEKAAAEFKVPVNRLMAIRRYPPQR
jgi:hypothetical protein